MFLLCSLLAIGYVYLLGRMILAWSSIKVNAPPDAYQPGTRISLLVPMRNEAPNLARLIKALQALQYPGDLLEIIFLDDHSTDDTASLAAALSDPFHYHPLPQDIQGKKAALTHGNQLATGQLIVTTDADCIPTPNWLRHLAWTYEHTTAGVICGPVAIRYSEDQSRTSTPLLYHLQQLDVTGTMLLTGGAQRLGWFTLANGANLAYGANYFEQVAGYAKDGQASGDDLFLVQKIVAQTGRQPAFLPQADNWVYTAPEPTWSAFWQQRLRWASKNQAYTQWRLTAYWGGVYLYCVALIALPVLAMWWPGLWAGVASLWLCKIIGDGWLLIRAARHFKCTNALYWLPILLPLHTFYVVLVGSAALLGKGYLWRDRKYGSTHASTTTD